jgi:hypothetical protein
MPEQWIRAVMAQESGGEEQAVSSAGAFGLKQVTVLPVPRKILSMGRPAHASALAWLRHHWGPPAGPRWIAALAKPRSGKRLPVAHAVIGYGFFSRERPAAAIDTIAASYPNTGGDRDHCNARSAAVTSAAGAVVSMTTRTPAENSTVIATGSAGRPLSGAAEGGNNGEVAVAESCAGSIRIEGEKPTGLRVTTPASSRRHV